MQETSKPSNQRKKENIQEWSGETIMAQFLWPLKRPDGIREKEERLFLENRGTIRREQRCVQVWVVLLLW